MYYINWDHAWKGRLTQSLQSPLPIEEYVTRLNQDLSDNILPFISMGYKEELKQQINYITPLLHTFKYMVILGIGGSALGAKALQKAFSPEQDRPNHNGNWLWIMDNIDSESMNALLTSLNPKETLVVTISKSGETVETMAQYFLIKTWLQTTLMDSWQKHCLFITDPDSGFLRQEAQKENIQTLPVPKNLGGRYSVLSAVGLIPAAFLGIEWEELLNGANQIMIPLRHVTVQSLQKHPAWTIAKWCYTLLKNGYTQLIFFNYIATWSMFGQWFIQLWAESLGKSGQGSMPLSAIGVTDQHSTQQMFLDGPKDKGCILLSTKHYIPGPVFPPNIPENWSWLKNRQLNELIEAEKIGTAAALVTHDVPLLQLQFDDTNCYAAGELMGLLMTTTIFTGWLLHINPLDQPAVELGKRLARVKLGDNHYPKESAILQSFLNTTSLGDPT